MPLYNPPSVSASPTEYLFVDGGALLGYLANIARKFFGAANFEIDFAKIESKYDKIFFYDAVPTRFRDEKQVDYDIRIAPQTQLHDRLRLTDRVHVYEGDARRRKQKGGLEQKMVDVMLAVDMLKHSFRRNMQRATLLSGDLDFKPLIDALVQEGMFVTLWYPPGETTAEVIAAADRRRPILLSQLAGLLTEESRCRFVLPVMQNFPPYQKALPPDVRARWQTNRVGFALFREDGDWVITRSTDDLLNRLHINSPNWDLLVRHMQENDMPIPDEYSDIGNN